MNKSKMNFMAIFCFFCVWWPLFSTYFYQFTFYQYYYFSSNNGQKDEKASFIVQLKTQYSIDEWDC